MKKQPSPLWSFLRISWKGIVTVLLALGIVSTISYAGSITPPIGTPTATFYTLANLYELVNSNTTSTAGDHDFTFADNLEGTGYTLTQLYSALTGLINPARVLVGTTYLGAAGTYNATNLSATTVKSGITFGVGSTGAYAGYPGTGWTGGTTITQAACDAQQPAWYWFEDGNGDGDTTDPQDGVCVKAGTTTAVSWNGAEQVANFTELSGRTATDGSANTIVDDGSGWTVNAYANAVVKISSGTASGCWGVIKSNTADTITVYGSWMNTSYQSNCGTPNATSVFVVQHDGFALYDNSWIGDWSCTGSFPTGTPVFNSFPTTAQVGAGNIALAVTDCYDGVRDLLPNEEDRIVRSGLLTGVAGTQITTDVTSDVNAWVGQKVLITAGTGVGSWGRVESNATSTVTVSSWSGTAPDVGSAFGIVYLIPHAAFNPGTTVTGGNEDAIGSSGPLRETVMNDWKGSRLPTLSDFFGYCGYKDGGSNYENTTGPRTADKTFGWGGGQVGRTDEFLDLADRESWEFVANHHQHGSVRIAGFDACSYFHFTTIEGNQPFRAIFRP